MAWQVMWTESAWRDLEEVADYIAKDSSHYAAAFVREARDAARTLAYLAERGRVEEGNGVKPKLYTLQDGKRMPVTVANRVFEGLTPKGYALFHFFVYHKIFNHVKIKELEEVKL